MEQANAVEENPEGNDAAPEAGPQSIEEAVEAMSPEQRSGFQLLKIAGVHFVVWLLAVSIFAAADSWRMLTGIGLASAFSIVAGVLAGLVTSTLIHEWGHFIGAKRSGGRYTIPNKTGLFVYDWDFTNNRVDQFMTMSIAGTVGGVLALIFIWLLLPADTLARAAVYAGAIAGIAFAGRIEWPVLRNVRDGADPLGELAKIDEGVLKNAIMVATVAGVLALWVIAP